MRALIWLLWSLIRVPAYLLLAVLEPFASLALTFLALASLLTAILFRAAHAPHFPFWLMLVFSGACALALALYHALMGLLGRHPA